MPNPQNKITAARTPETTDPATAILFNAAALSAGGLDGDPEGDTDDEGGVATVDGGGVGDAGGGDGGETTFDGDGDTDGVEVGEGAEAGGVDFGDGAGLVAGGGDTGAGVGRGGETVGAPFGAGPGACATADPTSKLKIETIATTKIPHENPISSTLIKIERDIEKTTERQRWF